MKRAKADREVLKRKKKDLTPVPQTKRKAKEKDHTANKKDNAADKKSDRDRDKNSIPEEKAGTTNTNLKNNQVHHRIVTTITYQMIHNKFKNQHK